MTTMNASPAMTTLKITSTSAEATTATAGTKDPLHEDGRLDTALTIYRAGMAATQEMQKRQKRTIVVGKTVLNMPFIQTLYKTLILVP